MHLHLRMNGNDKFQSLAEPSRSPLRNGNRFTTHLPLILWPSTTFIVAVKVHKPTSNQFQSFLWCCCIFNLGLRHLLCSSHHLTTNMFRWIEHKTSLKTNHDRSPRGIITLCWDATPPHNYIWIIPSIARHLVQNVMFSFSVQINRGVNKWLSHLSFASGSNTDI